MRLLAKDPAQRPRSAQEVVQALKKIQQEMPAGTDEESGLFASAAAKGALRADVTIHQPAVSTMAVPRVSIGKRRLLGAGAACVAATTLGSPGPSRRIACTA